MYINTSWLGLGLVVLTFIVWPSAQDVLKRPAAQEELGLSYSSHKPELTHQDFRNHVRTVLRGILPGKPFEVSFSANSHEKADFYNSHEKANSHKGCPQPSPTPKPQVPLSQPPKPKGFSPSPIKVVPNQVPPQNLKSPCPSPQHQKSLSLSATPKPQVPVPPNAGLLAPILTLKMLPLKKKQNLQNLTKVVPQSDT